MFQLNNPPLRLWALGSAWVRTSFEVDRSIAEIEGCSSVALLGFANLISPVQIFGRS